MSEIHIANEFSPRPLGRYEVPENPNNGERFRKEFLVPMLNGPSKEILINLDGLKMLTSSFMEEAFGGLVRTEGFKPDEILRKLKFVFSDPSDKDYVDEIVDDIKAAKLIAQPA